MFEFVLNNIEFFIFVLLLSIFLYVKRENLEVQGNFPLLYMLLYKTTWGIDLMKKWSKNHPRFWKGVAYCSLVLGIVGTVLMIPFMVWQLFFIIDNNIESGGGLVLPLDDGNDTGGIIFYVPFWYWIIVILFVAIVHEFGHGVIAKLFKIKVKSSGFAFAGIIAPILPAAFVEPDMEDLKTKERWKQIAVLGAGPFANVFFSIIFIFMMLGLSAYSQDIYDDRGIRYNTTTNDSSLVNIQQGVIFELVDDQVILNSSDEIWKYFGENLSHENPIELGVLNLETNERERVELQPIYDTEQNKSLVGIFDVRKDIVPKEGEETKAQNVEIASEWIFWFFLLNFGIGIMNLLPLWITDGGQITRVLLSKVTTEKNAMIGVHIASFISLALIIVTINPSLITG